MFTILGASGFIGSHLCRKLRDQKIDYNAPKRGEPLSGKKLGHVIYCIGLTADFRTKPLQAVEAHVSALADVIGQCDFDSLLYVSSTRVYRSGGTSAREEDAITVNPCIPEHLYDISKAMGESLTLSSERPARVVRLSNVYGPDFESENFLTSVIRDAVIRGHVRLHTSPDSERDYVDVGVVVDGLLQVAKGGRHQVYNLASGRNTSNLSLTDRLRAVTGCQVEFAPDAARVSCPPIAIDRMKAEFDFCGSDILADLEKVVGLYRRRFEKL